MTAGGRGSDAQTLLGDGIDFIPIDGEIRGETLAGRGATQRSAPMRQFIIVNGPHL